MTDAHASLAALGIEPVAWLYVHEFSTGTRHSIVCPQSERMESPESRGWTETPLYSATDLAPLIAKARRVEELEAALRTIIEHFDGRAWGTDGPGHAHKVPGVWDVTGKDCEWCTEWNAARAALKENTDATSD